MAPSCVSEPREALELRAFDQLVEHLSAQATSVLERPLQAFAPDGLENVTDGTCIKRVYGVFVVGRREDDGWRLLHRVEVVRCLDTIDTGHANIQENDLGRYFRGNRDRFLAIRGFANDLVFAKIVYELPQPVTCRLLVVYDQDSHVRLSSGNRNLTA